MCCPCCMTSLCSRIFYSVLQVSWSVLWLRHQFVTDVTAWLMNRNPSCSKNRKEKKKKSKIKWKEKMKTKSTIDDLDNLAYCLLSLYDSLKYLRLSWLVHTSNFFVAFNKYCLYFCYNHYLMFYKCLSHIYVVLTSTSYSSKGFLML